jgi:hypothetical protein
MTTPDKESLTGEELEAIIYDEAIRQVVTWKISLAHVSTADEVPTACCIAARATSRILKARRASPPPSEGVGEHEGLVAELRAHISCYHPSTPASVCIPITITFGTATAILSALLRTGNPR